MNRRRIGAKYEQLAAEYLDNKGYSVVERNYRNKGGEIDIVAKQGAVWVFCEIKYRSSDECGAPSESVGAGKQRRISRTALFFYAAHGFSADVPCRFDVISVYGDGRIEHIENAFEYNGGK